MAAPTSCGLLEPEKTTIAVYGEIFEMSFTI